MSITKLSVDCILRMIDDLRLEDEKEFYKIILSRFTDYTILFDPASEPKITLNFLARNHQEVYEKLQESPEFKKIKLRSYLNYVDLTKSMDVCCKICNIIMTFGSYMIHQNEHKHDDHEYTDDDIQEHIKNNSLIIETKDFTEHFDIIQRENNSKQNIRKKDYIFEAGEDYIDDINRIEEGYVEYMFKLEKDSSDKINYMEEVD